MKTSRASLAESVKRRTNTGSGPLVSGNRKLPQCPQRTGRLSVSEAIGAPQWGHCRSFIHCIEEEMVFMHSQIHRERYAPCMLVTVF
ncbi:hypothetical protein ASZ90_015080 [hydrocarbon metagenome]|uniref:Uncharacterized protein n=1 Tax=hydrocarbon metagenome TaxID=938273 RepID=A0A0W8F3E4_9ZZZZ